MSARENNHIKGHIEIGATHARTLFKSWVNFDLLWGDLQKNDFESK